MAMKLWEKEHGRGYDVPSAIDWLVERGILEDTSWHNDTSPSFVIADPNDEEYGLRIWVEHPLKSRREFPDVKRYLIQEGELVSESDFTFDSDDLEEVLIKLFERAGHERYERASIRKASWFLDGEPDETMKEFAQVFSR